MTSRSTGRCSASAWRWRSPPACSPAWPRSGRRSAWLRTRCSPRACARQPPRRRGACRRRSSWPKSPSPSRSSRRRPFSSSTCAISNACRWVSTPTASSRSTSPCRDAPATPRTRAERRRAEQARLMDALRQTPGVTGAAFANQLPAGPFCGDTPIYVEGRPRDALGQRVCLTRGHTGLLFDDADPAPRRPAAERVRQPARMR